MSPSSLFLDDPTWLESFVFLFLLTHVFFGVMLFFAWLSARRKRSANPSYASGGGSRMVNYQQSGPTSFSELLGPLPEDVREVATRLRAIVEAAIPDADEAVSGGAKMGMALYSIDGANNVICGIQPTENMCRLFFHGWKQLKESGYRLEGSGNHARHIKIRSSRELEPDRVADMIRIAAKHVEAGPSG